MQIQNNEFKKPTHPAWITDKTEFCLEVTEKRNSMSRQFKMNNLADGRSKLHQLKVKLIEHYQSLENKAVVIGMKNDQGEYDHDVWLYTSHEGKIILKKNSFDEEINQNQMIYEGDTDVIKLIGVVNGSCYDEV